MGIKVPVQICFSADANLDNVKQQLEELSETNTFVFHHCFLAKHQVQEKGFDTAIVDMLDEVLGNHHHCHMAKYDTFEDAMANIDKERDNVAEMVTKMFVLDSGTASGVADEIERFTNRKVIMLP